MRAGKGRAVPNKRAAPVDADNSRALPLLLLLLGDQPDGDICLESVHTQVPVRLLTLGPGCAASCYRGRLGHTWLRRPGAGRSYALFWGGGPFHVKSVGLESTEQGGDRSVCACVCLCVSVVRCYQAGCLTKQVKGW